MQQRLYRITPEDDRPNHYTDSHASLQAKLPATGHVLCDMAVGDVFTTTAGTVERIA